MKYVLASLVAVGLIGTSQASRELPGVRIGDTHKQPTILKEEQDPAEIRRQLLDPSQAEQANHRTVATATSVKSKDRCL